MVFFSQNHFNNFAEPERSEKHSLRNISIAEQYMLMMEELTVGITFKDRQQLREK
jgi:hypothetical protein